VHISGKLEPPSDIQDQDGSPHTRFSYPKYLSVSNIYSLISYPKIEIVESPKTSFKGLLYQFKNACIRIVTTTIPEPEAGVLVGILFGIKKAVNDEVIQAFITAGLIHIIVLSGYNIAIVVEGVARLFASLRRRWRFLLSYVAIYVFVIFAGAGSTVLRAGLMASIALFARQVGRSSSGIQVLILATAIIGLYEPRMLLYDISFKLSLLATLGLMIFTPRLTTLFKKVPEKFAFREVVASTVATQIVVFPYLLYAMGRISFIGIIANSIIVPFVPLVMFLGCVMIIVGFIYQPFTIPISYITYGLVASIVWLAGIFSKVPFASIEISIGVYLMLAIYIFEFCYFAFSSSGESLNK
jgi:competence protein ComEC